MDLGHQSAEEPFNVASKMRLADGPEVQLDPIALARAPESVTPELLCIVNVNAVHPAPARPLAGNTMLY